MKIRTSVAAAAAGLSLMFVAMVPTAAEAAPRRSVPCSYSVDESAGTISGSCTGGWVSSTFSGTYAGDTAHGAYTVTTPSGSAKGTFSAAGVQSGTISGTWTVQAWFGTFSGSFSAVLR